MSIRQAEAPARGEPPASMPHDEFLGLRFSRLSLADAVRAIVARCDQPFAYVVTPNAPHIVMVHRQPQLLSAVYRGAWLSLCDSQIVRRLAALQGLALPLVTGSDLVAALLAEQDAPAPPGGRKRLLIVGPDASTERALRARYPQLHATVLGAPMGLAQNAALRQDIAQDCMRRDWDILLLCVGCPAQELIASDIARRGGHAGVALCVGASIDFLTGRSSRAPRLLQALGLEWAFRLVREPRRLWRRYLVDAPGVLRIFLAGLLARRPQPGPGE